MLPEPDEELYYEESNIPNVSIIVGLVVLIGIALLILSLTF